MASKRTKGRTLLKPKKKLKQVINPILARALSHPLRGHILATLGDRTSSPSEIARELGIDARDLTYHFRVLVEIGMIKLIRTEKRRGSREHFYELNPPAVYIDDPCWSQMPEQIRFGFSAGLLQTSMDEAVDALRAGTFNTRDGHQSRTMLVLDEQGCGEVQELMDETFERMLRIKEACSGGRATSAGGGIPIEVLMFSFETAAGFRASRGRQRNLGRLASTRPTRRRGRRSGRSSAR